MKKKDNETEIMKIFHLIRALYRVWNTTITFVFANT